MDRVPPTSRAAAIRGVRRGHADLLLRRGGAGRRLRFFFQAEDGIRDYKVTGVQTCALPICPEQAVYAQPENRVSGWPRTSGGRSEERRVGKECRSRRWSDCSKNKI